MHGYIDSGKSDVQVEIGGHRVRPQRLVRAADGTRGGAPGHPRLQEEIFGPVVAVTPFDDDDEVVAMANDSTYGLAAQAWTRDIGHAHRIAQRLEAGMIMLNCGTAGTRVAVRRLQAIGLGLRERPRA
ncbi:MAG TPA: aldehyde dehydrogenase family protein [Mycobacteriales bacterium]|nr:aldehyde dehydrogenase family protein [Mycobacteriales bacterium]